MCVYGVVCGGGVCVSMCVCARVSACMCSCLAEACNLPSKRIAHLGINKCKTDVFFHQCICFFVSPVVTQSG